MARSLARMEDKSRGGRRVSPKGERERRAVGERRLRRSLTNIEVSRRETSDRPQPPFVAKESFEFKLV